MTKDFNWVIGDYYEISENNYVSKGYLYKSENSSFEYVLLGNNMPDNYPASQYVYYAVTYNNGFGIYSNGSKWNRFTILKHIPQ